MRTVVGVEEDNSKYSKLSLPVGNARAPTVSDPPAPALPTPVRGLATGRDRGSLIP
jgi:hypothetical protein